MGCAGVTSKLSKSDLDRWTDNVMNVLDSPRARRKFENFLSTRSFDNASLTLQFWKNCNQILLESSHDDNLKYGGQLNLNIISHARLRKNYSALTDFAIENINFDAHELRIMRQSLASKDVSNILKIVEEAQNSAAQLLLDEFKLFRDELLKEACVVHKCKK